MLGTKDFAVPQVRRVRPGVRKVTAEHERLRKVFAPSGDVLGHVALRRDGLPLYVRETVDEAQADLVRMMMGEHLIKDGGAA